MRWKRIASLQVSFLLLASVALGEVIFSAIGTPPKDAPSTVILTIALPASFSVNVIVPPPQSDLTWLKSPV